MKGYPSCALEVIEQFVEEIAGCGEFGKDNTSRFQQEVNESMVAFECPWRLSDGRVFQIESSFFHEEIIQKGEDMLREQGFDGAHEEFREARSDLSDGKTKDVILKAFKSFKSTLKTILGRHNDDINELLLHFRKTGFLNDIPEPQAKALCKQVQGFPQMARQNVGSARYDVQRGVTPPQAKPFKGIGSGVFKIVTRFDTNTYRTVYVVRVGAYVYVLHAF